MATHPYPFPPFRTWGALGTERLRRLPHSMSACLQPAASLGPQRNSYGRKATVLTSQIPVDHWHEIVGDATFGDAILDRLLHNAHRITLKGGSMRRVYDSTKDAATPHTSTD